MSSHHTRDWGFDEQWSKFSVIDWLTDMGIAHSLYMIWGWEKETLHKIPSNPDCLLTLLVFNITATDCHGYVRRIVYLGTDGEKDWIFLLPIGFWPL